MQIPELGVGLVFFAGIEPVLEANAGSIDVLEIEPQTFWTHSRKDGRLLVNRAMLDKLRTYSFNKLIHGIGFPVGGTHPPDPAQDDAMRQMIAALDPPWMSEHLSFNTIEGPDGRVPTLFLLPPRQTIDGAAAAVRSVRSMATSMGVPLAFETGVSYLRPRPDEMSDGDFVARVATDADCGILLDIHNLWCNERNGRQSVKDFLDQIPLERVWEVHLAGGAERNGYWVDAHSGPVQPELLDLARRVLPILPNVGAIILEVFPSYLAVTGEAFFSQELTALHRLWDCRGTQLRTRPTCHTPSVRELTEGPSPLEWENALGNVVIGRCSGSDLENAFLSDPGADVIRELLKEFRAASVVNSLRLSSRLIMLTQGAEEMRRHLERFWMTATPQPFASDEGEDFAEFLESQELNIPHLSEVLAFDRALLATQADGQPRAVMFSISPLPLLRALSAGTMPSELERGEYELVITPDDDGVA